MAKLTVGYRRLYDALGCSIETAEAFQLGLRMSDALHAEVYLGPSPRFGITLQSASDSFLVPGEAPVATRLEHQADSSKSTHPRRFFTEVACLLKVEATDELAIRFLNKESSAQEELLALAEKNGELLKDAIHLLAGTIGLKFHRQFVIRVLSENYLVLRPDDVPVLQMNGPAVEILQSVALNSRGIDALTGLLTACSQADHELQRRAGDVLRWLLRAWKEQDALARFLSLFVPLEMILEGVGSPGGYPELDKLRQLVEAHVVGDEQASLFRYLSNVEASRGPSLAQRFEALARERNSEGWQSDVQAFRHFNGLRNRLLHRGKDEVRLHISLGDNEAKELGDLVERYVSLCLFGEMRVYPTPWRLKHGPGNQK